MTLKEKIATIWIGFIVLVIGSFMLVKFISLLFANKEQFGIALIILIPMFITFWALDVLSWKNI
jgi:hypothetical protein